MKEKEERNKFIIEAFQNNPGISRRKVASLVKEKFGDDLSTERIRQIWMRYMGKYNVQVKYILKPKK